MCPGAVGVVGCLGGERPLIRPRWGHLLPACGEKGLEHALPACEEKGLEHLLPGCGEKGLVHLLPGCGEKGLALSGFRYQPSIGLDVSSSRRGLGVWRLSWRLFSLAA